MSCNVVPLLCCSLTEGLISYVSVISILLQPSRQYTGLSQACMYTVCAKFVKLFKTFKTFKKCSGSSFRKF